MERTCQGKLDITWISYRTASCSLAVTIRTPYGVGESLPNKERGIFHIQNANYWAFYNLEYVQIGFKFHGHR